MPLLYLHTLMLTYTPYLRTHLVRRRVYLRVTHARGVLT